MAAHFKSPRYCSPVPPLPGGQTPPLGGSDAGRRVARRATRPPAVEELASVGVAVGAIWAAVLAISLLSPDMVSGSEQQHMPVAAFGTWLWGLAGTWAALAALAAVRRSSTRRHLHQPLALGVAGIWTVAAAVSVLGPVFETGSDPTRLPLAALVAPVAATVLTTVVRAGVDFVAGMFDEADDVDVDELDFPGAAAFPPVTTVAPGARGEVHQPV